MVTREHRVKLVPLSEPSNVEAKAGSGLVFIIHAAVRVRSRKASQSRPGDLSFNFGKPISASDAVV
jgi:hypothetical protein